MTATLRWLLVAVLTGHGLLHLLGVAKGFEWADVSQLTEAISFRTAVLWLIAAALVLAAAALLAVGAPTWWWVLALGAAAISQIAIATSWHDARAGTIVNLILVLAAGYGFASEGPSSFHAQYRERATQALSVVDPSPAVVGGADLVDLPRPVAAYIRRSGAVGQPRVVSLRADFHGRIRSGPDAAWMPFNGQQVNTYGPHPQRIFLMDATRSGLPVTVLHEFADTTATMRVKLLSLLTVVDASGPEMNRGETVTVFNDLVVMAPGAIVDAPVTWMAIDALHVRGTFSDGSQTVSALLTFNADHDLVDFVSDDRTRASADGKTFTPQRWSTPLAGHHDNNGHRVLTLGMGVWHAPQPQGSFTYLEFHLDAITYNESESDSDSKTTTAITSPSSTPATPSAGR
ncbi:MAG: hypothetical protein QOK15_3501 [Nocardioidaceae bacterium]|nr:hypothetical protein [Nocardioidaceae bacterium]